MKRFKVLSFMSVFLLLFALGGVASADNAASVSVAISYSCEDGGECDNDVVVANCCEEAGDVANVYATLLDAAGNAATKTWPMSWASLVRPPTPQDPGLSRRALLHLAWRRRPPRRAPKRPHTPKAKQMDAGGVPVPCKPAGPSRACNPLREIRKINKKETGKVRHSRSRGIKMRVGE